MSLEKIYELLVLKIDEKELVEAQNKTQREIANIKMSVSSIAGPPDTGKPAKSFESKGNDVLGGIDLSRFEPR